MRISLARSDPALRSLPLLHRRADAPIARAEIRRADARGRFTARSIRISISPRTSRRIGHSATSALTARIASPARDAPAHAGAACRRSCASWSRVRNIPAAVQWPPNVARIEHLAPDEHRSFYNAQRFTLNITRADMREAGYSPSVRLFEAAACGTPIISDRWDGIEDFFTPGARDFSGGESDGCDAAPARVA